MKQEFNQQGIFDSISNKLEDIDQEVAAEYLNWLDRKTSYFKKTITKASYGLQPDNIKRGDVIWVEFGINVGTELSDFNTKGHFAVVWAVDLGNIIVIPLSSRDSPGSMLTFDLGYIKDLNDKEEFTHSYLKLDAIRSISKRRIGRIAGKDGGKIVLPKKIINKIRHAIKNSFFV